MIRLGKLPRRRSLQQSKSRDELGIERSLVPIHCRYKRGIDRAWSTYTLRHRIPWTVFFNTYGSSITALDKISAMLSLASLRYADACNPELQAMPTRNITAVACIDVIDLSLGSKLA